MSNIENDVKKIRKIITCPVCGCKQYSTNFARHVRTKKHKEADYADNKFEVERYEPLKKKNIDFLKVS